MRRFSVFPKDLLAYSNKAFLVLTFFLVFIRIANPKIIKSYWGCSTQISAHRLPLLNDVKAIEYFDLDKARDLDVLRYTILNNMPVQWIDDDMDSDCLVIDRNKDEHYAAGYDLMIDWDDEEGDQIADLQVLVDNSGLDDCGLWQSCYMWFIDTDDGQLFNFVDWHTLIMEGSISRYI